MCCTQLLGPLMLDKYLLVAFVGLRNSMRNIVAASQQRAIGCLQCIVENQWWWCGTKPILLTLLRLASQIGQRPLVRVPGGSKWFWLAIGPRILVLVWSYSHCCNAQFRKMSREYCVGFGGASLVHFPHRMECRSFPGQTCFFPPKNKPKISAGRWCKCFGRLPREDLYQAYKLWVQPQICDLLAYFISAIRMVYLLWPFNSNLQLGHWWQKELLAAKSQSGRGLAGNELADLNIWDTFWPLPPPAAHCTLPTSSAVRNQQGCWCYYP